MTLAFDLGANQFVGMIIVREQKELKATLRLWQSQGYQIGFVPTMGALHAGHISLVEAARKVCEKVVASIFVNPNQFNDPKDLERYPRMPEADCALLENAGCDVVFLPSVDEMYPEAATEKYDFGKLDAVLEGAFRPGHFNGVAQVVRRLFEAVNADKAFFGQKDFQQLMVVKSLVQQFQLPVEIIACPTLREKDGLAMSSRNMLLTKEEREQAPFVYQSLCKAKRMAEQGGLVSSIKNQIEADFKAQGAFRLDYFDICFPDSLIACPADQKVNAPAVFLVAAFLGKIRLIDNLVYFSEKECNN